MSEGEKRKKGEESNSPSTRIIIKEEPQWQTYALCSAQKSELTLPCLTNRSFYVFKHTLVFVVQVLLSCSCCVVCLRNCEYVWLRKCEESRKCNGMRMGVETVNEERKKREKREQRKKKAIGSPHIFMSFFLIRVQHQKKKKEQTFSVSIFLSIEVFFFCHHPNSYIFHCLCPRLCPARSLFSFSSPKRS